MTAALRAPRALLAATAIVSFCVGLDWAPLFDKDEGAFAEATREMLVSGNYLMTYLNGEPRYDKPILIYWLQAAAVQVFGLGEFAVRLPSALAALAWAWLVWRFARPRIGADAAFWAVFFLIAAVQVTIIAKAAIADALLNACIAGTMFSAWRHYETRALKHLLAAFAFMGAGALAKGPIALYVPFAAMLLFCWRQQQLAYWLRSAFHPAGIALFLLIALPWPIAAVIDQGRPILDEWYKQVFGRVGSSSEGHGGPVFYYLPVLIVGLLPWTLLFLSTLRGIRTHWREPFRQYLWLWFACVFVLFSAMSTKLPHYVIYGYTPLFLLMAMSLGEAPRPGWLLAPGLAFLAAIAGLPLVAPLVLRALEDPFARQALAEALPLLDARYLAAAGAALAAAAAAALLPRIPGAWRIVAMGWVFVAAVNFLLMPLAARVKQEPIVEAARIAKAQGLEVVIWDLNVPSFLFYSERLAITDRLAGVGEVILTTTVELEKYYEAYDALHAGHGIVLARIRKVKGL